jgi:hypothetical protein
LERALLAGINEKKARRETVKRRQDVMFNFLFSPRRKEEKLLSLAEKPSFSIKALSSRARPQRR